MNRAQRVIFYCLMFLISVGCSKFTDKSLSSTESNEPIIIQKSAKPSNSLNVLNRQDVENLIKFWENAQDAGDFEGYRSCYTKPFKGVKTVSKISREYDYAEWMSDRRKMIEKAVGLDVEVKNLQISIDGETATVEFDQYYLSKKYSDWGPKVLKIKQMPSGAKIVYELLKESHRL